MFSGLNLCALVSSSWRTPGPKCSRIRGYSTALIQPKYFPSSRLSSAMSSPTKSRESMAAYSTLKAGSVFGVSGKNVLPSADILSVLRGWSVSAWQQVLKKNYLILYFRWMLLLRGFLTNWVEIAAWASFYRQLRERAVVTTNDIWLFLARKLLSQSELCMHAQQNNPSAWVRCLPVLRLTLTRKVCPPFWNRFCKRLWIFDRSTEGKLFSIWHNLTTIN